LPYIDFNGQLKTKLGNYCDEEKFHVAWSDYVKGVVRWLKDEKIERDSNTVTTAFGLIKNDVITHKNSKTLVVVTMISSNKIYQQKVFPRQFATAG